MIYSTDLNRYAIFFYIELSYQGDRHTANIV